MTDQRDPPVTPDTRRTVMTDTELRHHAEVAVRGGRLWLDLRAGGVAAPISPAAVVALLDRIGATHVLLWELRTSWIDPLKDGALLHQIDRAIAKLDSEL